MNSVVVYRGREAAIHPYVECEHCGGRVDDVLRRLGNVETDVSALKVQVGAISAVLPHLPTKAELTSEISGVKTAIADLRAELKTDIGGLRAEVASLETRIIKWMIATVLTSAGVAFSLARFVH